jgi:DNA-binding XRE family transcriptional regulator
MSGHTPWREISAKARADPERRARIEQMKHAYLDANTLAQLRAERVGTQQALAASAGMSQARVAQIESGGNLYLSTLARYIAELGGQLEITAVFPDVRVTLSVHDGSSGAA